MPVASVKTKPKQKQVTASELDTMVMSIENLSADASFKEASTLMDNIDANGFRLGGVLSVIHTNGYFTEKGYETFKECVEAEFGMKYRKAMYLVGIYGNLVAADIEWDQVKGLGWTKLKEISGVLSKDNVEDLVAKAKEMTVLQLQEYVASLALKNTGEGGEDGGEGEGASAPEPSDVTTLTFKLHADQKETVKDAIAMAKKESGTDADAVALEYLALAYMNTAGKKGKKGQAAAPVDIKTQMKGMGYEKALEAFNEVWPDVNIEVDWPDIKIAPANDDGADMQAAAQ